MESTEQPVYTFQPSENYPQCNVCGSGEPHAHHLEEVQGLLDKGWRIRAIYLYHKITGKGIKETVDDLNP